MSNRTISFVKENGNMFKFNEIISNERKLKIEKHPQCKEYFRFKKRGCSKQWKWYIRISQHKKVLNTYYGVKK
jgi:hypothetical protein